MSRKPRQWYKGARYHITARGNRGSDLFYDDADFEEYIRFIRWCQEDMPFILHAYCLMTNHIHFLLEVKNHSPGEIMKFIQFRYAKYFNSRHKVYGHLFQGRYYSKLVDTRAYFLAASKYIHLNPVEAGICSKPQSYMWSSYPCYLSNKECPILTTQALLDCFHEPKRLRYSAYIMQEGEEAFGDYCKEYRPQGS
ncbi:transposase [Halobacillus aidingensis]|uniref:REP element-mobilizing transposase RayT n=1 Tax=Halobacillus aidingensis TaxID=240303 RepID=A0A1H0KHF3_HALAD|nr:transposase [Halobacillus aidingensis]SDO55357.1 REP element-mobilizing transposase RayT [Halobacillus aidingensis]